MERAEDPIFQREELLANLLLERISLRGIARILKVSLEWVINRAKQVWQSMPEELPVGQLANPGLNIYCLEAVVPFRLAAYKYFNKATTIVMWLCG